MLTDKTELTDPLSLPRKTASDTQPGSILAPLSPVNFAAGLKWSKTQPRAPSTRVWKRFALHPAPHLLGIKEELWGGRMSWGCPRGAGRSSCGQPWGGSQALCPAAQHSSSSPRGSFSSLVSRSRPGVQEAPLPWGCGLEACLTHLQQLSHGSHRCK